MEALAKQYGDKLQVMFVNIVEGGSEEEAFAEKHKITAGKRYLCLDLQPEYGVHSIPHVTVIHRGGMVVRNGPFGSEGFPDAIEPLLKAMVDESSGESGGATEVANRSDGGCGSLCVLL
mmetsp:Transcript_85070/g.155026  ORF Transcript_85070/g.155026 Transcript_85070/m.155026 type:complete len:119 (-) Transcript_85070:2-358(-)